MNGAMAVDLMALPGQLEAALKVGEASAPAGNYVDARLFTVSATIVFSSNVDLGTGYQYQAGEPYDVEIPSGDQTGIKTDASVTIETDAAGNPVLRLAFDPTATFLNVTGTGDGRVILAPVIRASPQQ